MLTRPTLAPPSLAQGFYPEADLSIPSLFHHSWNFHSELRWDWIPLPFYQSPLGTWSKDRSAVASSALLYQGQATGSWTDDENVDSQLEPPPSVILWFLGPRQGAASTISLKSAFLLIAPILLTQPLGSLGGKSPAALLAFLRKEGAGESVLPCCFSPCVLGLLHDGPSPPAIPSDGRLGGHWLRWWYWTQPVSPSICCCTCVMPCRRAGMAAVLSSSTLSRCF